MDQKANFEKSYLALTEFLLLSKKNIGEIGEKYNLSIVQSITLLLLTESRPMHNFTKIFHCDASNTTGIMDGLEQKKLVSRFESPKDRRVKMIKLLPKGDKIRQSIIAKLTDDDSFIIKKLSVDELTIFVKLLQKITS
jgi:DNA-binding MarR family transcriptional regulator